MKEKRVLAMFIISAVTLVASLAVTFGVALTLADPVTATGITRYNYYFNAPNDRTSIVVKDNSKNILNLSKDLVFQPSKSVVWKDGEIFWFEDKDQNGVITYEDDIVYADESISSKIKVVPIKITNNFDVGIDMVLRVNFDRETTLGKFTFVKIWNYAENTANNDQNIRFIFRDCDASGYSFHLEGQDSIELAIAIYVDQSNDTTGSTINWGTDFEAFNIEVENLNHELYH